MQIGSVWSWTIFRTHTPGVLYETFPAPEAHRILQRLEFHCIPKHSIWLNMVEIEVGVLRGRCLDRWIGERDLLRRQPGSVSATHQALASNGSSLPDKARSKRARAYPDITNDVEITVTGYWP